MFVDAMETITLKEVILQMDKGHLFSIGWRTCDLHKNTGGEYIRIDQACKHRQDRISQRSLESKTPTVRRNPNHFENSTRNIRTIPEGRIIKVHIRLIRKFNGKIVM